MSAIVDPDMDRAREQIAELRKHGHCFGIWASILGRPWQDSWSTDWFSTEALETFLERQREAIRSASGSSKSHHQRRFALLEEEIERRRKKYRKRRNLTSK